MAEIHCKGRFMRHVTGLSQKVVSCAPSGLHCLLGRALCTALVMQSSVAQATTLPHACHTPWLSNKRLCLRSRRSTSQPGSVLCNAAPKHSYTNQHTRSASHSASQIRAAAPDTLTRPAERADTDVAPGNSSSPDSQNPQFDWHNQWYAVGYER